MTSAQTIKCLQNIVHDLSIEKRNNIRAGKVRDAAVKAIVCQHINTLELQHKKDIESVYKECEDMLYVSNDKNAALELQCAEDREVAMNTEILKMDDEIDTLRYENEDLNCEIQNGRDFSDDEIRELKSELRKLRIQASLSKLKEVEIADADERKW